MGMLCSDIKGEDIKIILWFLSHAMEWTAVPITDESYHLDTRYYH